MRQPPVDRAYAECGSESVRRFRSARALCPVGLRRCNLGRRLLPRVLAQRLVLSFVLFEGGWCTRIVLVGRRLFRQWPGDRVSVAGVVRPAGRGLAYEGGVVLALYLC
jgi:hypothetical protein